MLAYLARYTHRVAISNCRLIKADPDRITFTCKDYRVDGPGRFKTMTLATHECIRRFLMHVLPKGFHRIRHYGLLSMATAPPQSPRRVSCSPWRSAGKSLAASHPTNRPCRTRCPCPCPRCGGRMIVIEISLEVAHPIIGRPSFQASGSTPHESALLLPYQNAAADGPSPSTGNDNACHETLRTSSTAAFATWLGSHPGYSATPNASQKASA
ncbi:MAG: transposase [Rhizobiales bacterium]|nr:transposase [Hyphomicrobiales bacterium]